MNPPLIYILILMIDLFANLTDQQKQAVTCGDGPVLVVTGPATVLDDRSPGTPHSAVKGSLGN
jgi:hypothetical protein